MPKGNPKTCTSCGRTHWSEGDEPECSHCRQFAPSRRTTHGGGRVPTLKVLDHDRPTSPSVIYDGGGQCMSRSRCHIHWRRLSHRHCPSIGCGRPMSVEAEQCGACTALELFEPQARELRAITHPEPKPDPFAGISYSSERAHEEYLADLLGLPVAVGIAL